MLQLPDFKQKQIIFIQTGNEFDCNKLRFSNDNLVLCKDDKRIKQISCHNMLALFIQGDASITTVLISKLLRFGVSIFLVSRNFRLYASIGAMAEGNYLLRHNQYYFDDDLNFAKNLVKNKIFNQLSLMKSVKGDYFKKKSKLKISKELGEKIMSASNIHELLGIEGSFSRQYFSVVFENIDWYRRMPRTKVDVNNVLLDMGYTLLFNFVDCLLRLHGFDTYKGIYHQLFFQRKSLTCDIMEPLRVIIDKALVKAYNLKQINQKDFVFNKSAYALKYTENQKYLSIFFNSILENKIEIFKYIKEFYFSMLNGDKNYPVIKI